MILEQLQAAALSAIAARDELVTEFQRKRKELGEARPTYKQEYAKAILQHLDGKNAEERKARAELATNDALFRYELIDAECDGLKAAISAKADEVSALQTLIRSHMDEVKTLHYGQHDQV
jgi:hypothetical protein